MKEIFEHIKDREWDWFGRDKLNFSIEPLEIFWTKEGLTSRFSLPDLLANKSFGKALWGENYMLCADYSFKILRDDGHQACINYIKKTIS